MSQKIMHKIQFYKKNKKKTKYGVDFANECHSIIFQSRDNLVIVFNCVVMTYKVEFRKSIYNLVGQMPKAQIKFLEHWRKKM